MSNVGNIWSVFNTLYSKCFTTSITVRWLVEDEWFYSIENSDP